MIQLDIHQPKGEEFPRPVDQKVTTHTEVEDVQAWLNDNLGVYAPGTYVVAHVGRSTYHYQLKRGRETRWDLLRQVVGS